MGARATVRTRSTWVAWSMVAIFVVGCGSAVAMAVTRRGFGHGGATLLLAFTAFMAVGAVIVAHRPGNAIGWIFSAVGLLAATGWLAMEYAAYAYITRPGSLPGAIWAAWYQQQWWIPMFALVFVATPLLFPTGRLPSARWRPIAVVAAGAAVTLELLTALQPTIKLQDQNYRVDNPIGLAGIPDPETNAVGGVMVGLLTACIVGGDHFPGTTVPPLSEGGAPAAQMVHLCRRAANPDDPGGRVPAGHHR
jgi:hypothetical protein